MTRAIKGFDANWKCRDFQFEIGKTYTHEGKVEAHASGFHACEYGLDVFKYYNPTSKFALVEMSGELSRHEDDSKIAAGEISLVREISIKELVDYSVEWILAHVDSTKVESNTGSYSTATNTGDCSVATNTGDYSVATNTGDCSVATNTGYKSAATNTADKSAATNTGYKSAATNTADKSAATNTGYYSAATNTGDYSVATNTGYYSAATNTGSFSVATNTGNCSVATNTGYYSAASVEGKNSVAIATGYNSIAKASLGSAIVLCEYDDDGNLRYIKCAIAGKEIKSDVFYILVDNEFVEIK
jgi:hypothetical protein